MKKQLLLLMSMLFCLTACQAEPLKLEQIDNVPAQIDQLIMYGENLQLITGDSDNTYIAIRSQSPLEAAFDIINGTLQIHFHEAGKVENKKTLYVYALKRGDATYEAIEVYVNNVLKPFDIITTY